MNLVPYGANTYKSDFAPWAWSQVSQGGAVYAMPSDFGPMGFYYDQQTLAKYHITPPSTWADVATDAVKLHKANSSAYLMNCPPNDLQWLMSVMGQAGAWPFTYSGGSNVTINWTGAARRSSPPTGRTSSASTRSARSTTRGTEVNTNLDKGVTAAAIDSAWAPSYFVADVKQSMGQWRAAPLPQWSAGANVGFGLGGSTYPVFTQSKHPKEGRGVLRVADLHRRVLEHRQDAAVLAVPDLPAHTELQLVHVPDLPDLRVARSRTRCSPRAPETSRPPRGRRS